MAAILRCIFPQEYKTRHRMAALVFRKLDTNHDGIISFADYSAIQTVLLEEQVKVLENEYNSYQLSSDGTLCEANFVEGTLFFMEELPDEEFKSWYDIMMDDTLVRRHRKISLKVAGIPVPDRYRGRSCFPTLSTLLECTCFAPIQVGDEDLKLYKEKKKQFKLRDRKEKIDHLYVAAHDDHLLHEKRIKEAKDEIARLRRMSSNTVRLKEFKQNLDKMKGKFDQEYGFKPKVNHRHIAIENEEESRRYSALSRLNERTANLKKKIRY